MGRVLGWLWLIAFAQLGWAADASDNQEKLALLEFFDGPPVVVQGWPTIPAEFKQRYRLPDDVTLGLFLCNTDLPLVGCSAKMVVLPFNEIVSIVRDRNLAYVNLNKQPEHTAWVVMDKSGKKYRAEVPPIPPVIFSGEPSQAWFRDFVRAQSSGTAKLVNGIGAATEVPVYAIDLDKSTSTYRTIPLRFLKGLKLVSRTDAQEVVERYSRDERLRIEEQQRKEEQARQLRQEQERADEERRKAVEAAATRFMKEAEARAVSFRKTMKPGDSSHCGMVIEVKRPIAQVQTIIGAVWLKINQIYRPGDHLCLFENGAYRD